MLSALVSTLSRTGIAAAVVTLVLGAVVAGRPASERRPPAMAIAAFAVLVAAVMTAGFSNVLSRFGALDQGAVAVRLGLWGDALQVAADSPITGIGIRAYSATSFVYQSVLPEFHVGAAHNDWLQLAAEGGLLVGIPALILLGVLARRAVSQFAHHVAHADYGTTYWIRAGAAVGLIGIALQSLVEFSLQMPGNTVMFAVLLAITIAPLRRSEHPAEKN